MIVVDPGAAGGIVRATNIFISADAMPKTDRGILDLLDPEPRPLCWVADVAYLEELVKFTGRNMPSSAMATYAGNWGIIKGMLTALRYRIVLVPPKKWQAALGLGGSKSHASKTAWKNHLKQRAEQLFPNVKVTLSTCDALLMYEAATKGLL